MKGKVAVKQVRTRARLPDMKRAGGWKPVCA